MKTDRPARKRPQKPAGGTVGRRKVTMWLDRDLAKRLRQKAIQDDKDIGEIAGPAIEQAIGHCYWAERTARPPAAEPAVDAAELGDGLRLAEGLG